MASRPVAADHRDSIPTRRLLRNLEPPTTPAMGSFSGQAPPLDKTVIEATVENVCAYNRAWGSIRRSVPNSGIEFCMECVTGAALGCP